MRKYIKSLSLNKKNFGGIRQSTLISARTKTSRRYVKERRLIRIKRLISIFLLVLFLGFLAYIVFFSSIFKIKNVKINKIVDYGLITEREIEFSLQDFINKSHNNLIFLKCTAWQRETSNDSRLEFLNIRKKWPNSIEINLQEAQPLAILKIMGDNEFYYLNKRGGVIKVSLVVISKELENSLNPIFYDQSKIDTKSKSYTNFLEKLLVFVQSDILSQNNIYIQKVNFNNIGNIFDAQITTKQGWQIFINSEVDLGKQLISLLQILEEEIEDRNDLEYIDLRFGTKMFYKIK